MKRLLLLLLLLLLVPVTMRGQASNRAGLIMQFGDGSVQTYCVAFAEESISGVELLQRAQLDVIAQTSGNNAAVCKIGEDGCDYPAESCFCKFGTGQRGEYWAFWQLDSTEWSYAQLGAGAVRVRNGDVNGWAWGAGSEGRGAQPPVYTFDQICLETKSTQGPTVNAEQLAEQGDKESARQGEREIDDTAIQNPQSKIHNPLNYAIFGALVLASVGMILLVLRRGAR